MRVGPIADLKEWRKECLERIGDRKIVASISGGKDSTAMALLLKEAEIPFDSFFVDTGWEHEMTVQYVKEYLPQYIGPIRVLSRKEGGMTAIVRNKGYFPGAQYRYCTGMLKLDPAREFMNSLEVEPVNAVGIRAQESARRAKYPEWEYSGEMHCEIWRPIMLFTEEHLIELLSRHGVRPNPLYLLGAPRVGCWPCIFASKRDLRLIATEDPERIDLIADLEIELTNLRRRKDPNADPITWFRVQKQPILIHDAVEWAFKDKSDKELFVADDRHMGCMRWGMCEFEHPFKRQQSIVSKTSS